MKESILGSSRSVILRLVALAGFLFFIGIGTTYSQNYMGHEEAALTLRTEIQNLTNSVNASPFQFVGPEMYINTAPQIYANWWMMENVLEHLYTNQTTNVRDAIDAAYAKSGSVNAVNSFYFTQANNYVDDLLQQ